ncbi:MAG: alpha/beta hydrolase [Crenarchaeota archaeon]|nr:alpha/beta hydrolase [Thermoproteota archaeon]
MPKIVLKDIELNYEDKGKGVPLVLIHGASDSLKLWEPLTSTKLSERYRIIAIDVRGHGKSTKPNQAYSIEQFSKDLKYLLEKLRIKKANLLGFSMGSAIAMQFALENPEKVTSLVLLSAFSYVDQNLETILRKLEENLVKEEYFAFLDELIKLVNTPEFLLKNQKKIQKIKKESIHNNSSIAVAHVIDACINFDIKKVISQVSCPALIISGREDILTPLYFSEQIHQAINGSEWRIIEDVGHNLLIPEKTSELLQIITKFLNSSKLKTTK